MLRVISCVYSLPRLCLGTDLIFMTGCCGMLPLRANLWCFSGALLGAYWEPSWAFEGPSWALLAAILGSGEAFLNDLRGQIRKGTILSFRTFLGFLLSFYIFVCFHVFIHCTGRRRQPLYSELASPGRGSGILRGGGSLRAENYPNRIDLG